MVMWTVRTTTAAVGTNIGQSNHHVRPGAVNYSKMFNKHLRKGL
jgi:hypothetical protein